jgi:methyltransferase (TIGR00027 family)
VRARLPSQTAALVAFARALAHEGMTSAQGFSDPAARALLPFGWRLFFRLALRGMLRAAPARRARAIAQLDVVPLRVLALDAGLRQAIASGCRQLVILGAGLDTRAFRLDLLSEVDVFEVDHPATQAYKRRTSASLPRRAHSLTFVANDFERDSLRAALRAAGHRADRPTVWLWEGVVMYLTDAAFQTSLSAIAAASAPGSVLLLQYHEPEGSARGRVNRALLALWGEQQIGQRPPEAVHQAVRRVGFEVTSDTQPVAWAQQFGASPPAGATARITHLLVARR